MSFRDFMEEELADIAWHGAGCGWPQLLTEVGA